jgi:hypothetical protein
MSAKLKSPEPAHARDHFEKKVKFTTGPVELECAMGEQAR